MTENTNTPATKTKAPKTYTIIKSRRGEDRPVEGTLEELIKYFGYTLQCGNSWNSKISLNPKSVKGLVSALNKSAMETRSINSYELGE